jgi:hypothetical protein
MGERRQAQMGDEGLRRQKTQAEIDLLRSRAQGQTGGGVEMEKAPTGFRWTADGSLEAIPGGPATMKTPDIQKKEEARANVSNLVKELEGLYGNLDEAGGIVNVEKSFISNIPARIGSSVPGQAVSGAIGTQTQSIRNKINMARPLLINYIRQASEMGARGLDSEKELEFYLSAATDPTRDLQANLAALSRLDEAYGLGGIKADEGVKGMLKQEYTQSDRGRGDGSPIATGLDPAKAARLQELRSKRGR